MIQEVKNVVDAMEGLLECLLIAYRYDAIGKSMSIVCDYHKKAPGADRAFLRLRFDGVSDFRRVPGAFAELQRFVDVYSTRETRAATVVQKVNVDGAASPMRVALGFGHSFGGISLACERIVAELRSVCAIKRSEDVWEYRDVDDGAPVDFYDPFA